VIRSDRVGMNGRTEPPTSNHASNPPSQLSVFRLVNTPISRYPVLPCPGEMLLAPTAPEGELGISQPACDWSSPLMGKPEAARHLGHRPPAPAAATATSHTEQLKQPQRNIIDAS